MLRRTVRKHLLPRARNGIEQAASRILQPLRTAGLLQSHRMICLGPRLEPNATTSASRPKRHSCRPRRWATAGQAGSPLSAHFRRSNVLRQTSASRARRSFTAEVGELNRLRACPGRGIAQAFHETVTASGKISTVAKTGGGHA